MKPARELASEVLGHQSDCLERAGRLPWDKPLDPSCTCNWPLPVWVAARRGTLRKEHAWYVEDQSYGGTGFVHCRNCDWSGWEDDESFQRDGACHPLLDAALCWELFVEISRTDELEVHLVEEDPGQWWASPGYEFGPQGTVPTPEEAVARLWLSLSDAGLLEVKE